MSDKEILTDEELEHHFNKMHLDDAQHKYRDAIKTYIDCLRVEIERLEIKRQEWKTECVGTEARLKEVWEQRDQYKVIVDAADKFLERYLRRGGWRCKDQSNNVALAERVENELDTLDKQKAKT